MAAFFVWCILGLALCLLWLLFCFIPKLIWKKFKSYRETAFLRRKFFIPEFSNTKYNFKYVKTCRRYV